MTEAETHLMKAASLMPAGVNALSRLIHLRRTEPDSPEFRVIRQLSSQADRFPPQSRATLHMAAGKAFADLGDYRSSFEHLSAGNALTAELHGFDLENHLAQADRMMTLVTKDFLEHHKERAGLTDLAPIFICGMPRSGTTLMEQMLSLHSKIQAGGELNAARAAIGQVRRIVDVLEERDSHPIAADEITQIAEAYIANLRNEGLTWEIVTDKLPINYLYVGLLALAFPRARFIIMRRHPMDCCLSTWSQDFGRFQPFSTNFHSLGQAYIQYKRTSDYWARLLPGAVRIVPYEELVEAPETTMRKVLEFCDLDWEPEVLDHTSATHAVNTASLAQVRRPLYSSSVAKWRRYGPLLAPLAREVESLLSDEERIAAGLMEG